MVIHVRQGKGAKDRLVPLSLRLLEELRAYWSRCRPRSWLFPGHKPDGTMTGSNIQVLNQHALLQLFTLQLSTTYPSKQGSLRKCRASGMPLDDWPNVVGFNGLMIFLAISAFAIYGAHRIEVLRQEAVQARRLGQYQLIEQLGAGGMGEVYLAEHVLLRRPCAVKLIRADRMGDVKNLKRFEREVQITATLTHPNTVQVFDYGHAEDGTFYYVMEFLPGLTLEQLLKAGSRPRRRGCRCRCGR
jgi:hypothetical protein